MRLKRVFPLFTPILDNASTKKNTDVNQLTSPDVIRHKMLTIIVSHPNRVIATSKRLATYK
jgi:hypothetical protein